jgi:hypothetical protein
MATTEPTPQQSPTSKIQEDEKSIKSLRSLTSFITLVAWVNVLVGIYLIWVMVAYHLGISTLVSIILSFAIAGTLFWCDRLLEQKRRSAITIYALMMIVIWLVVLIMRLISSQPLFRLIDLAGLILPGAILFEMYRLRRRGFLV